MPHVTSRRSAIKSLAAVGLSAPFLSALNAFEAKGPMLTREIPSSGEKMPVVGLGTWKTFDARGDSEQLIALKQVLVEMNRLGGKLIDSSPMYGTSEETIGDLTSALPFRNQFFYADKVWTSGLQSGIKQMQTSMAALKRDKVDLMQVHNLVDWKVHIKTLRDWKEKGKIRYWGITHYLDSAHTQLEKVIVTEKPDFVQCNYSIKSRNAERSLFDTARRNNTAVIINRPYEGGELFRAVKGRELPPWSKANEIHSWGQFFLKFILSNTSVTAVIPGTSKPHHLIDNMKAGYGSLPDEITREKMHNFLKNI